MRGYPVGKGQFTFVDKKDELSVDDLNTLSGILPIPRKWAYDKFGIPQPEEGEDILEPLHQAAAPSAVSGNGTTELPEPDNDPNEDDDPPVRNSDRSLWRRIVDFFDHAPAESGAGTIRTSDDTLSGRLIREVWKGEGLFSPELFRYFSGQFLNALQTAFENPVNNMDTGFAYNTPDDVFRTALETNLYHFSAAKTLAEVQELNRILRSSEYLASYIKKLTADRWKLPIVQKMKQEAETDMLRTERNEQEVWNAYSRDGRISLTDYDGRIVVINESQFLSHTTGKGRDNRIWLWDAMIDTLMNPDEVWLNNEIEKNAQEKAEELNTYCLMKFYRDEVVAVNYRIEGEELVLKTWYIMQTNLNKTIEYMRKRIWDKRRFGLLVKKR